MQWPPFCFGISAMVFNEPIRALWWGCAVPRLEDVWDAAPGDRDSSSHQEQEGAPGTSQIQHQLDCSLSSSTMEAWHTLIILAPSLSFSFFSPPMSSLGAPHRCCPPSWCLCHLTELMRWEALLLQIGCDGSWVFPKGRSVLHPAGQEGEMGLGPSAQHFHSFPCQTTGWKHRTGDWHQQLSHSCLLSLKTETCFSFYALLEKNNLKGHYSCWIGCELGFPAEILIMQAIMKLIPLWQICRAALPSADSTVDN